MRHSRKTAAPNSHGYLQRPPNSVQNGRPVCSERPQCSARMTGEPLVRHKVTTVPHSITRLSHASARARQNPVGPGSQAEMPCNLHRPPTPLANAKTDCSTRPTAPAFRSTPPRRGPAAPRWPPRGSPRGSPRPTAAAPAPRPSSRCPRRSWRAPPPPLRWTPPPRAQEPGRLEWIHREAASSPEPPRHCRSWRAQSTCTRRRRQRSAPARCRRAGPRARRPQRAHLGATTQLPWAPMVPPHPGPLARLLPGSPP
mmetsp:Transcript_93325/g.301932  ORF Transcript_93325/g.301932 Transcript_93325/m.301932 type:complete len:255 (+) Transcript_93325:147-911(+)